MTKGSFRQINIPYDREEYEQGFGEKVWVMMEKHNNDKITNRENGIVIDVILCNDCIGFSALQIGTKVQCELRGDMCPVIAWDHIKNLELDKETVNTNILSLQIAYPCGECGEHFCSTHKIYLHHSEPFAKSGVGNEEEDEEDEDEGEDDDDNDDNDDNNEENEEECEDEYDEEEDQKEALRNLIRTGRNYNPDTDEDTIETDVLNMIYEMKQREKENYKEKERILNEEDVHNKEEMDNLYDCIVDHNHIDNN